jgi:hypothetical protein
MEHEFILLERRNGWQAATWRFSFLILTLLPFRRTPAENGGATHNLLVQTRFHLSEIPARGICGRLLLARFPKHETKPKSNRAYWWRKPARNKQRDRLVEE